MPKVISWTPQQWKKELSQRLWAAKEYRKLFERKWAQNAEILYNPTSADYNAQVNDVYSSINRLTPEIIDNGIANIGSNYAFKYISFIHSQMSSNPPIVLVKPTSSDLKDRKSADAADKIARYGYRHYRLQEKVDQWLLRMLIRGVGYIKIVWDPEAGDIFDFNEGTKEFKTKGDFKIYAPSVFDIWVDSAARHWDDVRYIIERHYITPEEAQFRFPDKFAELKANADVKMVKLNEDRREENQRKDDFIEIYEYYEKALPVNGMAGRHVYFMDGGTILTEPTKNHHYQAQLPYIPLTYLDVEDSVYGKSVVEYISPLQDMLNRFDNAQVDAMEAHGTIRLLVPDTCEIADDSITNQPIDIIKFSGNRPPTYVNPPQIPPDMARLRQQLVNDIQELSGVTEASLGIMRRETSGFSQQTAIEQSNQIRKRLFNKYAIAVEDLYKHFLGLVKMHWDMKHKILVIGNNNAFEAANFSQADLAGGFDLICEYGTALPLDPNLRREQIMILLPFLKEAGMDMRSILSLLKLNDLETIYDQAKNSADRQKEIFDTMIASAEEGELIYIEPRKHEDHVNMLKFAEEYFTTEEYRDLPETLKKLIEKHVDDRMNLAAQNAAGNAPAAPPMPTPMAPPIPGMM